MLKINKIAAIAMGIALAVSLPSGVYAALKNLSKSIKKGDTVYFGKYEQDGNIKNGKERIEWKVLNKKGNKVLLISRKILDVQPYNIEYKDITWEKCTLRKWLNKDFLKAGFSADEQKKIRNTRAINKDNSEFGTKGGKDTTDKIFLLSTDEANKYLKGYTRIAEVTNHSIKQLARLYNRTEKDVKDNTFGESKGWYYWLRSPGDKQGNAANVDYLGLISKDGSYIDLYYYGCRPALWVDM